MRGGQLMERDARVEVMLRVVGHVPGEAPDQRTDAHRFGEISARRREVDAGRRGLAGELLDLVEIAELDVAFEDHEVAVRVQRHAGRSGRDGEETPEQNEQYAPHRGRMTKTRTADSPPGR